MANQIENGVATPFANVDEFERAKELGALRDALAQQKAEVEELTAYETILARNVETLLASLDTKLNVLIWMSATAIALVVVLFVRAFA